MPRGQPQNLKKGAHKLTAEEASKGGKRSAESRREKANLRKCLKILLETDMEGKNGKKMSGAEALSAKLFQSAMKGDVRAFEVLRDTAGQKPVEKIVTSEVDPEVIADIEKTISEIEKEQNT